jgi:hypothetical protein
MNFEQGSSLVITILGIKKSQRYAVRRRVVSAHEMICKEEPSLQVSIVEKKTSAEILPYTAILAAPSLLVDEKMVCKGRIPARDEIIGWLQEAACGGPGV